MTRISYTVDGKDFSFGYDIRERIDGTVFGALEARRRLKEGNRVGYPYEYDYVRIFHGTQKTVFYQSSDKPDPSMKTESPIDFFANSASILEQGFYRSRNDRNDPETADYLSQIRMWESKLAEEANTYTKGIFLSWIPSHYGNIVFDVLIPTSDLRFFHGSHESGVEVQNLQDMRKIYDNPGSFIKESMSGAESNEIILSDKLPLKNIVGVADKQGRYDSNFVTMEDFVNSLDKSKLPNRDEQRNRKLIKEYERLKKIYELFNGGEQNLVNPLGSLSSATQYAIDFKIYNNKNLPNVKQHEIREFEERKHLKQRVKDARTANEEKRKERMSARATNTAKYINTYNRTVQDISKIMSHQPETVEIDTLGNLRSLFRNALQSHDIRNVLKGDFKELLEIHKECIEENRSELPEDARKLKTKIQSALKWFPIIKVGGPMQKIIHQYSKKDIQKP